MISERDPGIHRSSPVYRSNLPTLWNITGKWEKSTLIIIKLLILVFFYIDNAISNDQSTLPVYQ